MAKTNDMANMPMRSLIFKMSWPPFCSMMMAYSYNLVDSMFVAWAGEEELAAVSLAFPCNTFITACAIGFGVGINVLVARHLGEKDQRAADHAATNGLVFATLIGVLLNILLLIGLRPYLRLSVRGEALTALCMDYMQIVIFMVVPAMIQVAIQKILQGTGNMIAPMLLQMSGVAFNFVFDPMMIFGWGPFPELGVKGAAIATVFGYILSAALSLYVLLGRRQKVTVTLKGYLLDPVQTADTLKIGFPSFLMNVLGAAMVSFMNGILIGFSIPAVSVFGAYFKVQQIIERAVNSLVQGVLPIMSFQYGAKRPDRLHQALRLGLIYAAAIMGIGMVILLLFPAPILGIFRASADMLAVGIPAMRIMGIGYVFAGCSIIFATYMQAIKNIRQSVIINILRQAVLLMPLAFILSRALGIYGAWIAFPAAEAATFVYACLVYRLHKRAESSD